MDWLYALSFLSALIAISSFWMKGMIRLRVLAILGNFISLIYALLAFSPVTFFQHVIVLPLNIQRLREMLKLVQRVKAASGSNLSIAWLKPFMERRECEKGEIVFRRGDQADQMFLVATGRYRLIETGLEIAAGQMVGELGLLTPGNTRTQGFECIEPGELLTISYAHIRELYYQNPEFGFYFLELTSRRLLENIARLEDELARRTALAEHEIPRAIGPSAKNSAAMSG